MLGIVVGFWILLRLLFGMGASCVDTFCRVWNVGELYLAFSRYQFFHGGGRYMTSTAAATEIIPRMWLGNIRAAKDTEFHRAENIAVVFNCTKTIPFLSIPHQKH